MEKLANDREHLRAIPLFEELSEDDLAQLYAMAQEIQVPEGRLLITEGEPGDSLYVILQGQLEITKRQGDKEVRLGVRGPGEFIGEMALVQESPRYASARALQDSRLLVISRTAFRTLLTCSVSVPLAMLRTVMGRLQSQQTMLVQYEKMAGLGKLTAGLMHELNNPAAAISRSAAQLRDALDLWDRDAAALSRLALTEEQQHFVESLRRQAHDLVARHSRLDPLAESEREDAVEAWLEEHGVERAWEIAPPLVSGGWDPEGLEQLMAHFSIEAVPMVVTWLAATSAVFGLLDEIRRSAEAISALVTVTKQYSYVDQGPVQLVDIHDSLENTLVILRHKLQQSAHVVRDYQQDLPRIEAYGSELNQVWTNIIDNAIDAIDGRGQITVHTRSKDGKVMVEICDTGTGIPPEIRSRIFEPFFTTKEPGSGTGQGLYIVYDIVVHKHGGEIEVESRAGKTCFQVTLPRELGRSESGR